MGRQIGYRRCGKQVRNRQRQVQFGIHAVDDLHAGDGIAAKGKEIIIRCDGIIAECFGPDGRDLLRDIRCRDGYRCRCGHGFFRLYGCFTGKGRIKHDKLCSGAAHGIAPEDRGLLRGDGGPVLKRYIVARRHALIGKGTPVDGQCRAAL